ncbi:MAG: hypothetical protein IPJ65_38720 [Archangiaceae bacterium]|nr:hypothetical protein [Archangiaceae bacterium]
MKTRGRNAIDYRDLAERIRTAKLGRAQREQGQPPPSSEGLPIATVVDALFTPVLAARVDALAQKLQARPTLPFGQPNPKGLTPLEAQVAEAFRFLPLDGPRETARAGLADAVALHSDRDGFISGAALEKAYGPEGEQLFRELAEVIGDDPSRFERQSVFKYHGLGALTVERAARSSRRSETLAGMPVLGQVVRELGSPHALEGLQMVAVQHLLPSNPPLFEAFARSGLDLNQLHFIGKTYSTDPDVFVEYDERGYRIDPASVKRLDASSEDPTVILTRAAEEQLTRLFAKGDPKAQGLKYVLLDEGGFLTCALHQKFPQFAHQCTTVEQTQHGVQELDDMVAAGTPLLAPSVLVAESELKKTVEAIFVGENVRQTTVEALTRLGLEVPKKLLVAGYGAVGRETARAFAQRHGVQVSATDTSQAALEEAGQAGCRTGAHDALLADAELYVSAAGRTTLTLDDYEQLPDGAVVANAASGIHPLGMDQFSEKWRDPLETIDPVLGRVTTFRGKRIQLDQGLQRHQVIQTPGGKRILVLAQGNVVNLAKGFPNDYAQLIEALLYVGVMQALHTREPGKHALDALPQERIRELMDAFLSARGQSLTAPDFDG